MKDKCINVIKNSAVFLLLFMSMILLYTTILFFFKISINKFHIVVEFALTIIFFIAFRYFFERKNDSIYKNIKNHFFVKEKFFKVLKVAIIEIILGSIIFTLSVAIIGKIYDTSSDGNSYHKLAVGSMKNGWNPIYESSKDYTIEDGNAITVMDGNRNYLWADHYAIGTEIIGANIYAFSGNIESGKAFNLVMIFVGFGILLAFLNKDRKIKLFPSILLSFILACNPISITQVSTYYVDTMLLECLFIIFAELMTLSKKDKFIFSEEYFILAMAIIECSNAKFTGLAYAAVFCGAFYLYWLVKNKKNKEKLLNSFKVNTIFYVITVLITVCVVGFSSYTLNFIKYGSPFYPLYGKNHVENMVNREIPKSMYERSHVGQFLISIFSKGENVSPAYAENVNDPDLKVPFMVTKEEIKNYIIPDIRVGGFGPLFSGIFIISVVVLIYEIIRNIRNKTIKDFMPVLILNVISLLLVALLDGSYWSRYIPYIYFIVIWNIVLLFEEDNKITNIIGYFICLLAIVNTILVGYPNLKNVRVSAKYVKGNLDKFRMYADAHDETVDVKLNDIAYQGVLYNVDDLGIKVNVNQNLETTTDVFLFSYKAE